MWKRTRSLGGSQDVSGVRLDIQLQRAIGVSGDLSYMAARLIHVSCPSLSRLCFEIGGDTSV
jgi:hypothetical protein